MVSAKQEKAYERIKNFRAELTDYREQFNRLKSENDERVSSFFRPSLDIHTRGGHN